MNPETITGLFTLLGAVLGASLTLFAMFLNSSYQHWSIEQSSKNASIKKALAYATMINTVLEPFDAQKLSVDFDVSEILRTMNIDQLTNLKNGLIECDDNSRKVFVLLTALEATLRLFDIDENTRTPGHLRILKESNSHLHVAFRELRILEGKYPPPTFARFLTSRPMFKDLPKFSDFKEDGI